MTAVALPSDQLIGQLGDVVRDRGLHDLAARLRDLQVWVAAELAGFERELDALPRDADIVQRSAGHLLALGGKHLRPMCVALAAKVGDGFDARGRGLAVAVELIHNATLLHDDVVDLGEVRRGQPAARTLYGNAASIFAGDWLLVQALMRVQRAALPGLLDFTLAIIDEMIAAEALQLQNRGRVNASRADYLRVVEGKTAALFRWAMVAGGRSGGLDGDTCAALERFGAELGVAFQLVDDLLDFTGDVAVTGKALFTDLREGKMTYPLLVALDGEPRLGTVLEEILAGPPDRPPAPALCERVLGALDRTGAIAATTELAHARARAAIDSLDGAPAGRGRDALITVAQATVHRRK